MLNIATDIQSLTEFRRGSARTIKQLKKSKRPMVLTVNGIENLHALVPR